MKYISILDPQIINAAEGGLIPKEHTNNLPIYNNAIEHECNGKVIESLGIWGATDGVIYHYADKDELCILSSGTVKITNQDGEEMTFSAGQGFIIKSGFNGTWESIGNVRKWYVIYK